MAAPETIIRPATPADLPAVAKIFTHYVNHTLATFEEIPPTVEQWRGRLDELTDRGLPFLVTELSGEVAGYAYAGPWRPKPAYRYTVEDTVYIVPDRTGKGLGGALLGALVTESTRAGVRQMIAVIADNGSGASAALHRRFGFTDAGLLKRVGRKHGRWIDTRLMQRALVTGEEE
ncbi:acetyltransferase [Streptomyces canus]|uniref:Acetyltransferase n=1 Tax=Streptomyces canus TaxID=58343 RepID=A0A117R696_9ACTN|nr:MULTISPECIES: GNAT family N-acetyltransferase [Streptomyces]KUN73381.1 acetyltransferase [Streptomyces canus]MDI5908008.1 GNAT family N-acetyltransferase [Streptomyces sp. 12257]